MDFGQTSKTDIKRDLYIFITNDVKSLREVKLPCICCSSSLQYEQDMSESSLESRLAQGNTSIPLYFRFLQTSSSIQFLCARILDHGELLGFYIYNSNDNNYSVCVLDCFQGDTLGSE